MYQNRLTGASHGDELTYLFKPESAPAIEPGSIEDISIRRITKLWTNFAKTGNPNSKENDALLDVVWEPVTSTELNFLNFDEELRVGVDPDGDRMAFWDDIYKQYSCTKNKNE